MCILSFFLLLFFLVFNCPTFPVFRVYFGDIKLTTLFWLLVFKFLGEQYFVLDFANYDDNKNVLLLSAQL